jgi:hypothetical protein
LKYNTGKEEEKYNSLWNIASDFNVHMSFSKEEIKTMLDDYVDNNRLAYGLVIFLNMP